MDSPPDLPIHDLLVEELDVQEGNSEARWDVLRFDDHILSDVRLVQVIQSAADKLDEVVARGASSEVWVLLDGGCQFAFRDLRADSPTHRAVYHLTRHEPTRIFVPSGVAFGYRVISGPAQLIRVSDISHGLEENSDQTIQWPVDS